MSALLPEAFHPEHTVLASRVMSSYNFQPSEVLYVTPAAALESPPPGGDRFAVMGWAADTGHYVVTSWPSLEVARLYLQWAAHFRAHVTRLDFDAWQSRGGHVA